MTRKEAAMRVSGVFKVARDAMSVGHWILIFLVCGFAALGFKLYSPNERLTRVESRVTKLESLVIQRTAILDSTRTDVRTSLRINCLLLPQSQAKYLDACDQFKSENNRDKARP